MTVYLTESEREAIEVLAAAAEVAPGTRCPVCNRRRYKPRQEDSPAIREIRVRLPNDRMDAVEEAFDALQEITGVDPYSYPKGTLLEAMLVLAAQHREQLSSLFKGDGS